jgi:hypothetical protein
MRRGCWRRWVRVRRGANPSTVAPQGPYGAPRRDSRVASPNGVYKTLRRHGLNTRRLRLSLVAGYRAPLPTAHRAASRAAHQCLMPRRADQQARPAASPASCPPPAGSSSGSSPTMATSSRQASTSSSPTRSKPATPTSAPADRRRTDTSSAYTDRTSRSAGAPLRPPRLRPLHRAAPRPRPPPHLQHDRTHHGRLTQGRIPADIVYGARQMEPR